MKVRSRPSATIIIVRRQLTVVWLAAGLACGGGDGDGPQLLRSRGAEVSPAGRPAAAAPDRPAPVPVILFLGTSLTAGLGVPEDQAYPARIQAKLDSAGLAYRVVNAGVSGETSAGGLRRIEWLLRQPIRILIIELGANDGLRGLDPGRLRENLQAIIDRVWTHDPEIRIVLAGMEAPPNLGATYTREFRRVFRDVAAENDAALVPFLLDGVAAVPHLNQADRIHPTAAGHEIIANVVWQVLEPIARDAG